jgi:uncharacterized membrane protein (UPF0127 family)
MKVKLRDSVIEADAADNFFSRMMGLSFSKKKNMLFTMDYEYRWPFWMFGVWYPLSIVFLDRNKEVVDIKRASPLSLNPKTWRTYVPVRPSKYVFETPFELKIKIGDRLSW